MSLKFLTVPSKILAESITSAATSFRLNNVKGWDTEDLVSGDFGTQHFIIFRNATKTAVELMEIDPTTIASASITIVRRGLQFDGDLTTEVTANKLPWTKGDTYVDIGTDTPQMLQWLKEYIDDTSIAGAVPASTSAAGIVKEATQAQADAGTGDDGTYQYIVPPDKMRAKNYNDYVVDTGSANAYAIAPSPAITAYAAGQIFTFKAANANTGASTLNVNSLGTKNILRSDGLALASGQIIASQVVEVCYDGTQFKVISELTNPGIQIVTFTAGGTWTKDSGLKFVIVECQGAGGTGGAGSSGGGGGGGGGYTRKVIAAASLGATETITIGAAGVGSGNTSFGSLLTAGNGGDASGGTGGSAGAATGGDLNIPGQAGQTVASQTGGLGGSSVLGFGGGQGQYTSSTSSAIDGNAGSGYGAGGSGASAATDGSPTGSGAEGTGGIIIVTEYYS